MELDWKLIFQLVAYIVTLVSVFWKLKNQVDNFKDFQTGVSGILRDIRAEYKDELKVVKTDFHERITELKCELNIYREKNDNTINDHYRNLDKKIDELRNLIISKK